ncbi:MAG: DNA repair protein RecO C-terminal domain-containing protein, partial [Spirochaetales bacterium]|nr:DNA repair protein RecO C-terminal domain-containing protein [Spirochaetales bacterium]
DMAARSASFEAILLRSKEVPSGARVVTLLSADDGIVDAFVFGGGKSKLRSLASPWHRGTAWVYRDQAKGLVKLTDFDPALEYPGVRASLDTIAVASFMSEFIIATSALGGDWLDAFTLACGVLEALDAAVGGAGADAADKVFCLLVLRALDTMGLARDPGECAVCAGAIRHDALHYYSRRSGGFVCERCVSAEPDALCVPAGAFSWLNAASNRSFAEAARVGLARDALGALKAYALDAARRAADAPLWTLNTGML